MAFTRHYIDDAQPTAASGISGNVFERIFKIGTTLWGALVDYNAPGHLLLYKSTAAGLVSPWTLIDALAIPAVDAAGFLWFYTAVIYQSKLYVIAAVYTTTTRSTSQLDLYWTNADPAAGTPTWAAWSALPFVMDPVNSNSDVTLFAGPLPGGKLLLAFSSQDGAGATLRQAIRIRQYDGASWADFGLVSLSGSQQLFLQSGLIKPTTGLTYLFVTTDDTLGNVNFGQITVDISGTIGAVQNIITSVNTHGYNDVKQCAQGVLDASENVAIAIPFEVTPGFSAVTGTVKVAFGDVTIDPLNPVWTVTDVTTGTDLMGRGIQCPLPLIYAGTTLWSYFMHGPSGVYSLYRSFWNGSVWSAEQLWYDSTPDGGTLENVQLVKGFSADPGILLNVGYTPGPRAIYDGPPLAAGRRTFASQPMHAQQLAGHSRTSRIP